MFEGSEKAERAVFAVEKQIIGEKGEVNEAEENKEGEIVHIEETGTRESKSAA